MTNEWFERYPALESCRPAMESAAEILCESFRNGGQLLICGNGGSCADSGHIAGELLKGFRLNRPIPQQDRDELVRRFGADGAQLADALQGALPAISLPDQTAVLTAFANDVLPEAGFAQLTYGYGRPGDVLLGISTSGNSANVVDAARVAAVRGMKVIALVGARPCKMDELADAAIHVPETDTAHVQELHLPVYHALCAWCEQVFFGEAK